jgi:hypothetical protein
MPQVANPIGTLNLYTPQAGDPHSTAHPYVVYDPPLASGFTLILNPQGDYSLSFSNGMGQSANNNHATARVYLSAFADAVSNPIWAHTVSVPPNVDRMLTIAKVSFSVAEVLRAAQIWVGSWWDDGSYPSSRDGVIAYFRDHPEGAGHHTVPIIVG